MPRPNALVEPNQGECDDYHELGHALTALALPGIDRVHKVSIEVLAEEMQSMAGAIGIGRKRESAARP